MWYPDGAPVEAVAPEIGALLGSVEQLRARRRVGRTPYAISQELVHLRHAIDLAELEFAATVDEFVCTDEYELQGSVTPIDWVRHNCKMSGHAAAASACVGEMLPALPMACAAVTEQRIGYAHLALLARTAQAIRHSPTAAPFDEEPLLTQAEEHSVSRFRHDCHHARHAADAQGFLADQVDQVEWRRLDLTPCDDGRVALSGLLDSVGGATLRSALEPLARRAGREDDRRRERRLADALVELADHVLDSGSIGQRGGQRPHLQVTATLETLRGIAGAPAGELEYSLPISAATAQRLACDASITRVLLDSDSTVIDVGRARRVPGGAARRALHLRDKGCVVPGCERPAGWTVPHHLQPWAKGGLTDLDNLVLLCGRHHWMVHEGGWQIVRTSEGVALIPPVGRYGAPRARAPDQSAVA
jgi:Domain of unknown function (DUF222)/HNH endonuclease